MAGLHIDKDVLKTHREKMGYSLEDIAARVGTSRKRGSRQSIFNCILGGCKSKTIMGIAEVLKISPWWKLLVKDDRDIFDPEADTPLILCHRETPLGRRYFEGALGSGTRVLLVSIMTGHSFRTVDDNLLPDTKLDVLTWNPKSIEEISGFAKHLAESGDKVEQTRKAMEKWDEVAAKKLNVRVFNYSSTPTMQGVVVKDRWAVIELMPYNTMTGDRPALLLRADKPEQREAFEFFAGRFEDLFMSADPRKSGEAPNWERSR